MMLVVAHPDDECFGFGGALALAADRGIETCVLCLTDGQAATNRGAAVSSQHLGEMRRAEFAASCNVLGVTEHELLDYHDGQLEFADFWRTALQLVERMRGFRPDVVLTFGADGGPNTHNDHMMVSMLTQAAFHWAGRPKPYTGLGHPFQPRRLFTLATHFFIPGRQAPFPCPWTVALDIASVQQRKAEAFRAHTSQAPLMESTKALFELYGQRECYTLLATELPQPAQQSTDLFEGL